MKTRPSLTETQAGIPLLIRNFDSYYTMSAIRLFSLSYFLLSVSLLVAKTAEGDATIPLDRMQAIYEQVKTPFKYGVVLDPPAGKKVDCPAIFRHDDKWYMVYVQLEEKPKEGYSTQIAESTDLLHWKPLGTILDRGDGGAWDQANAAGGIALSDTRWDGSHRIEKYAGYYWLSYLGGHKFGYETTPLSISFAFTDDPAGAMPWRKLPAPVLQSGDADARPGLETVTLYKSFVFHDTTRSLGAPFVMFYNAKGTSERIFTAVSEDLKIWRRFGTGPAVENLPPAGSKGGVISGDPQIMRMDDLWVMFYFGAFWKPGAFDTFAASRDLISWTKWSGEDLVKPSEPYDNLYAHKPWILKHKGVVYHFYCAVGGKDQHRSIALATSKNLR